jgi:hypothetical protein
MTILFSTVLSPDNRRYHATTAQQLRHNCLQATPQPPNKLDMGARENVIKTIQLRDDALEVGLGQ